MSPLLMLISVAFLAQGSLGQEISLSDLISRNIPSRIVGGSVARPGQFPYQASLRIIGRGHFCGGSIISKEKILSAAHCTTDSVITPQNVVIVVGTTQLNQGGFQYKVSYIVRHENYNQNGFYNDIAIFGVQGSIQLGSNVQTISLNTNFIGYGERCVVSGWGLTSYPSNQAPNDLMYLVSGTIDNRQCQKNWSVSNGQICIQNSYGQGACKGDSGGPLVSSNGLIGVVSYGNPCANGIPDVFTRVSVYIDWINSH